MTPEWFNWAEREIGKHEQPENRGPVVQRYIDLAHCGEQGDPWCAIFVNAALEAAGVKGTRSASSQSFRFSQDFVRLDGPAKGAIVVFWRGNPGSGLGHVGFYDSETDGYIYTLGGNESDMVRKELLAKKAARFGFLGYYWPKSVQKPAIAKVAYVGKAGAGSGKVV